MLFGLRFPALSGYDSIPFANGMISAGMSCQLIHYVHEELSMTIKKGLRLIRPDAVRLESVNAPGARHLLRRVQGLRCNHRAVQPWSDQGRWRCEAGQGEGLPQPASGACSRQIKPLAAVGVEGGKKTSVQAVNAQRKHWPLWLCGVRRPGQIRQWHACVAQAGHPGDGARFKRP